MVPRKNKEYYRIFRNGLLVNRAYYYKIITCGFGPGGLKMAMGRPFGAHSVLQGGVQYSPNGMRAKRLCVNVFGGIISSSMHSKPFCISAIKS